LIESGGGRSFLWDLPVLEELLARVREAVLCVRITHAPGLPGTNRVQTFDEKKGPRNA